MRLLRHLSQAGFSMVELMVALVLGVILTSGVISVFISSKNTYNTNNSVGQVEEGGRYALNFMQPILSLAGSNGCSRPGDSTQASGTTAYIPNTVINSAWAGALPDFTPMYNFGLPVFGYEANSTGINATIPSNGGETVSSGVESYPSPDTNASDWTPALSWNDPKNVLSGKLNVNGVGGVLKYNDVLMVHEALTTAAIHGGMATVVTPGADGAAVYVPASTSSALVTVANFTGGEFAIASDCQAHVAAFQITSTSNSTGALNYAGAAPSGTPGNSGSFSTGPINTNGFSVLPASTYVFYVGQGADKGPALFEGYLGTNTNPGQFVTEQLVSGVENMQVLYGVDTDKDQIPNYFTTADQVQSADGASGALNGNWGNVVSVRVSLVMQSDNNSIDKASASTTNIYMLGSGRGYTDNTILATPADQRLRRVFVETFSFRNMLP